MYCFGSELHVYFSTRSWGLVGKWKFLELLISCARRQAFLQSSRTSSERLMYVQFTSCVCSVTKHTIFLNTAHIFYFLKIISKFIGLITLRVRNKRAEKFTSDRVHSLITLENTTRILKPIFHRKSLTVFENSEIYGLK